MQGMVIQMNDELFLSLAQLRALSGRNDGGGFCSALRTALQLYRPHRMPCFLSAPEASAKGRAAMRQMKRCRLYEKCAAMINNLLRTKLAFVPVI